MSSYGLSFSSLDFFLKICLHDHCEGREKNSVSEWTQLHSEMLSWQECYRAMDIVEIMLLVSLYWLTVFCMNIRADLQGHYVDCLAFMEPFGQYYPASRIFCVKKEGNNCSNPSEAKCSGKTWQDPWSRNRSAQLRFSSWTILRSISSEQSGESSKKWKCFSLVLL